MPYFVAATTKNNLQSEWKLVFLVTSGVYLIGGLSAVFFHTSETEKWALDDNDMTNIIEDEF